MGISNAVNSPVTALEVERLEELLEERLGLSCVDWQRARLASLVARRAGSLLADPPGAGRSLSRAELQLCIEQVSVSETYFFREPAHFAVLADTALPELLRHAPPGRPLRILSVGCSSGEEIYSAAITLRQHHADLAAGRIRLQGIDIHAALLQKAERARYSAWALRATSPQLRQECFRHDGEDYQLRAELRGLASFEERNLLDPDPYFWRPASIDVIFCRNVLIYFSERSLRLAIARFSTALADGGFLFLGHSETLRGVSDDFEQSQSHDTFFYRKKPVPAEREARPVVTPPGAAGADPDRSAASWFEHIQRSTQRVAELTAAPPPSSPAAEPRPAATSPGWEPFAPVLQLIAAEQFDRALELLEKLPPPLAQSATATLIATTILCGQGRRAASQQAAQRLLDDGHHVAEAHFLLGLSYEHQGDLERAQKSQREAIRSAPRLAMAHLHLGILLRRAGQRQPARLALRQALELLLHEPNERIQLFGGGFQREALLSLCRAELRGVGGEP